ncbi:hypothetical protein K0M31_012755 [Melipona bicolor]|uniref:Uncharacterized protein n=1 Tax=Melipona bicolor TaxID=60889 RepID=A0AA40FJL7_9HYME|nr:hypothetical protein K0M31_012755 [Melipona bicolor]
MELRETRRKIFLSEKKFCGNALGHLLLQERNSKGAVSSSSSTGEDSVEVP